MYDSLGSRKNESSDHVCRTKNVRNWLINKLLIGGRVSTYARQIDLYSDIAYAFSTEEKRKWRRYEFTSETGKNEKKRSEKRKGKWVCYDRWPAGKIRKITGAHPSFQDPVGQRAQQSIRLRDSDPRWWTDQRIVTDKQEARGPINIQTKQQFLDLANLKIWHNFGTTKEDE